jgi:hypothetical protein
MHPQHDHRPTEPNPEKQPRHEWVTDWGMPPHDGPPTGSTSTRPTPPKTPPPTTTVQAPVGVWRADDPIELTHHPDLSRAFRGRSDSPFPGPPPVRESA